MNSTNTTNTASAEDPNFFQNSKTKIRQYFNQRLLLLRLQATEKVSKIAATLISVVVMAVVGLFLLIFGSIALGYWFSSLLGSYAAGFGIVALIYFLLLLCVLMFLKRIMQNFFINKFIKLIHKKD